MTLTLLELPRELLALIMKRTLLNDPAVIATFKVNRSSDRLRSNDTYLLEKKRPKFSNGMTIVNKQLHDIFEEEARKFTMYKFTISEQMLGDISHWRDHVQCDIVRYVRFDVMLTPYNEQASRNRDQISRAIQMFTNARDIEVVFVIGDRDDRAVGLNGHTLLFDFGRTLRSMQKLQAYRIVYIRLDREQEMDDVSEYAVTRVSATSWKTSTRLTCPGLQQMRPYALEFDMQIGSRMLLQRST